MVRVEEGTYPNGAKYRTVWSDNVRLGSYEVLPDGGYRAPGCRKLLLTQVEAQKKTIERFMAQHQRLAGVAMKALQEFA